MAKSLIKKIKIQYTQKHFEDLGRLLNHPNCPQPSKKISFVKLTFDKNHTLNYLKLQLEKYKNVCCKSEQVLGVSHYSPELEDYIKSVEKRVAYEEATRGC